MGWAGDGLFLREKPELGEEGAQGPAKVAAAAALAVSSCPPGPAFNGVLFRSFRLELGYAGLLSAGAVVAPWLAALVAHRSGG